MRFVFLGATRFGLRCLDALKNIDGCAVAGVVTTQRVFGISYRPSGVENVQFADFGAYCARNRVPCEVLARGMNDPKLISRVKSWTPDAFLVVGWYHLVPPSWRNLAPAYGLHASLLPDYSGGAPLVWAIINGEKRTGITLFQLADGVDNGPIVGQAALEILYEDTIASVYERIEALGLQLLTEHMPGIVAGTVLLRSQDESRRRIMPQRSPDDGLIDWRWPADRIRNFVRAQTHPYPGAFTRFRGEVLRIWEAREWNRPFSPIAVGRVSLHDGRVMVGCSASVIELAVVEVGGQETTAAEWWHVHLPGQDERFTA